MKIFKRVLVLCLVVLTITTCFLLVNENKKNSELNDRLSAMEQELSDARKELLDTKNEVDSLIDNLEIETDKNKDMEETIDDLKFELSIANEKISNMEIAGVPVYFTDEEVNYIAKAVFGESRGCSKIQQSAVVWCILNRLDSGYWGNTIKSVVTYPSQFHGYSKYHPVTNEIRELVEDVLFRWNMEKMGATNIGRTLPERFMYFHAASDWMSNIFTTDAGCGEVWDFDCWNPYE